MIAQWLAEFARTSTPDFLDRACELAQALRIPKVIVPACPGALSALGILISDVVKDHSRTVLLQGKELPVKRLNQIYSELQRSISTELQKENWKGRAVFERSCDMRYRGQGYELNLPFGNDLVKHFHAEHKRRYGYSNPEKEIEIVTVRLRGRVPSTEKLSAMKMDSHSADLKPDSAKVSFSGKPTKTPIIPRQHLKAGRRYKGPAIVTEYSATTVIPIGHSFQIDRAGNLVITVVI